MNTILLLTDYKGQFFISTRFKGATFDLGVLASAFAERGFELVLKQFSTVDFLRENYSGQYVMYQSSEDRGLYYKDYIEDILLGLKLQGAELIPQFEFFRAHHNKAFMEILRDLVSEDSMKNIVSHTYGVAEEFLKASPAYPIVIKRSDGAGSYGVRLARNPREGAKYAKSLSRTLHLGDSIKEAAKTIVRRPYIRSSDHRKKFLVQQFVPGLTCDHKVLVYGNRYFPLRRAVRKRDFRASGSGLFTWSAEQVDGILNFAKSVFEAFAVPFVSLDIGTNGSEYFLFELQFIRFGNYALESAPFYFTLREGNWVRVQGKCVVEEEFARSVVSHIERLNSTKDIYTTPQRHSAKRE